MTRSRTAPSAIASGVASRAASFARAGAAGAEGGGGARTTAATLPPRARRRPWVDSGAVAENQTEQRSLYRRHRPRTFAEVVGQEAVVRTLRNAVELGRVHHAYLF